MYKRVVMAAILLIASLCLAQADEIVDKPQSGCADLNLQSDRLEVEPVVMTQQVWQPLAEMTSAEKRNSRIALMIGEDIESKAKEMAFLTEYFWNSGDYAKSIEAFIKLGDYIDLSRVAIGLGWNEPEPTSGISLWGSDIRIGNRDSVLATGLDLDRNSGHLFATLMYQGDNYITNLTMNFSSDGGLTWSETFRAMAPFNLTSICPAVIDEHCYVAFTSEDDFVQARLAQFRISDGAWENFDNGDPYIYNIYDPTPPQYVKEVHILSNQDFDMTSNFRLYYTMILSTGELKFYWSDETAEVWHEISTGVTDADKGLDACLNLGFGAEQRWLWVSYIDMNNNMCIDYYTGNLGPWVREYNYAVGAWPSYTSIGACRDTVHCFYEFTGSSTYYIRYNVNYSAGEGTWYYGFVDDTTTNISERPSITARYGGGLGATYRYYASPRESRFTWRNYGGLWSEPYAYTDNEPYYNQASIEYLGGGRFGVVYTSWHNPYEQAAYFDRGLGGSGIAYLPGDANMIAGTWPPSVAGNDVTYLVNYFRGIAWPCYLAGFYCSGDINGSCSVTGGDVTYLVNYFRGLNPISYCPDYPTLWENTGELPPLEPPSWPNCYLLAE